MFPCLPSKHILFPIHLNIYLYHLTNFMPKKWKNNIFVCVSLCLPMKKNVDKKNEGRNTTCIAGSEILHLLRLVVFSHYFPKVFYFIIPSLKLNWWISFWGKRPIFHGEHLSFRKRTSQVIPGVLRNGSWKLVASSIAILTSLLATRVPIFDGDSSFGAKADLVVVVFSRWNFHLKSHYGSMGMVYL